MSIAIPRTTLAQSPTWRQFQAAAAGVVLLVAVGCVLYAIETLVLRSERRFVENPAETMTRAIGIAHFSIGWLFLFTSPRLRNRAAIRRLTFCTLGGIAFCWFFAWGGADKNPVCFLAYLGFFFIHETWDEAYLFRQSGELPADTPNVERFLRQACWCTASTFITLMMAGQIVHGHFRGRSTQLQEFPSEWLVAVLLLAAGVTTVLLVMTIRAARQCYGSVRETIAIYQPLVAVYAGLICILILGSFLGSIGTSLVIMLHGMTWFVVTYRRLTERPQPATGLWSWIRGTPTGFLTLHIVALGVALALFGLRTHVWERTGLVCDLVSKSWFPYWAIMHISTAFWRSK